MKKSPREEQMHKQANGAVVPRRGEKVRLNTGSLSSSSLQKHPGRTLSHASRAGRSSFEMVISAVDNEGETLRTAEQKSPRCSLRAIRGRPAPSLRVAAGAWEEEEKQ